MSCSPVTGGPNPIFEDKSQSRSVAVAPQYSSAAMSNRSNSLFASDLEEMSSNYTLQLSLAMQFTGLLHKVLLACHAVVVEKLDVIPESSRRKRSVSFSQSSGIASSWSGRSSSVLGGNGHDGDGSSSGDCVASNFSRVSECVSVLSVLLPYCLHWLKLTNSLKLKRSKRDSSFKNCK